MYSHTHIQQASNMSGVTDMMSELQSSRPVTSVSDFTTSRPATSASSYIGPDDDDEETRRGGGGIGAPTSCL